MPERPTIYVGADDVVAFHALVFSITLEQATDRLRSRSVLEGAVAHPRQHAHYAGADLAAQAAVLVHGIAEGQPFVDGNKQTALATLFAFLKANGHTAATSEAILADRILYLGKELDAEACAAWVRGSLVPSQVSS